MRIIGVTGGVGSGKSAVLNYIEEHFDSRIVKADEVGHMLMMPGRECYEPVIELFGEWVVKEDGSLNRSMIGDIVFDSPAMLKKLDDIIHPAVKKYILREIEKSKKEDTKFFFIEAAILLEEKYDEICDEVWYIYCEKEVRMERLRRDRGYSDEQIRQRMENQLSEEEFEARCDFQLYNDEDVAHTYLQIERRMRTYYESV
ncbi:MAG TPA: dephospho-CoA kinase [Candidatus Blautia pullicola]|jgi:dephospho-CoA kinase|uniref:Dephospho-CoA kinase n=1 Tax=Candidatus Blautia pullicola TaxID=2838498 RepID=A0A9D2JT98_9FIRM|nr:dephospho-CoA kinase [Candidatus Blautia pullicola]